MIVELWIYLVGAVIAGWVTARAMWDDSDRYGIVPCVMFLWPVVVAGGIVGGLLWLFVESAKPGRIKLPRPRRERLQQRIDELEAELGMREAP